MFGMIHGHCVVGLVVGGANGCLAVDVGDVVCALRDLAGHD